MLTLISFFFLYVDVYLNAVDIIPDAIGFLLLALLFLIRGKQRACSPLWALAALLGGAASALTLFTPEGLIYRILAWLLPALASFFCVWQAHRLAALQASHTYRTPPTDEFLQFDRTLVHTALALILICDLCAPVLNMISVLSYLLLFLRLGVGLLIGIRTARLLCWKSY